MLIGDKIAIGIFILCVILGVLGTFRWLMYLITGLIIGLLILACIGLLVDNPTFDELSQGVFKQSVVIPYIRSQVKYFQDFFRHTKEALGEAKISLDDQEDRMATTGPWRTLSDSQCVTMAASTLSLLRQSFPQKNSSSVHSARMVHR